MVDYSDSIMTTLFKQVDHYSAEFVANTYSHLVSQFSGTIYLFVTIYVGLLFMKVNRGLLSANDLPFILLRTTAILTFAMNFHYFYLYVYDIFVNGPLEICKAISFDGKTVSAVSISSALDRFLTEGLATADKIQAMGGWSNPLLTIMGWALYAVTLIAASLAAGLIFLSKIASCILLALSPMFILFALYDATKGWFDSYLQQLYTYFLIPIMASTIMMITLSVTQSTMQYMGQDKPTLKLIIPFLIVCVCQIWLFLQVTSKCASLASGFSLSSFTSSMRDTKNAVSSFSNMATGGAVGRGALTAAGKGVLSASKAAKRGASATASYLRSKMKK